MASRTILTFSLIFMILKFPSFIFSTLEGPLYSLDTTRQIMVSSQNDTARLNEQIRQAWLNLKNNAKLRAHENIENAFRIVKDHNLTPPYTLFWVSAEDHMAMADYGEAFSQVDKALTLLKPTSKYQDYVQVTLLKVKLLNLFGKFSKSREELESLEAMAITKQLKGVLPVVYREMANLYSVLNDTVSERRYNRMMLESSVTEKNDDFIARAWFRLGEMSVRVDSNMVESNRQYKEALRIRQARKDSSIVTIILNRISWNYYLMRQYDTSVAWYNRCLENGLLTHDYKMAANVYGNMGTIYRDLKDYKKALYFYGKSSGYAYPEKDWSNLSWVYFDMSKMFALMGEYKKAYESHILYKQYSDSVGARNYSSGLADARMRYETDAKEKELEVLSLKLERQRYFTWGSVTLIILALLVGFLLFRQTLINNKRRISEMNRKISEITQANLRQQMNPHFIFNTLNSIQYYMYQHDKIATNNYLTKFSSLMRKTLENSQHTAIPIKDELDALGLYLELETLRFKEKFHYSIHVDEEIDTLIYKIPTMLIQPYVENAICHGLINKEGKGYLRIDLNLHNDHIACIIEDDGIGREAAMELKRNKNENHNSLGTRITESRLNLVNTLYGTSMKVIYTDLKDHFDRPNGTRVEIQIPIMT